MPYSLRQIGSFGEMGDVYRDRTLKTRSQAVIGRVQQKSRLSTTCSSIGWGEWPHTAPDGPKTLRLQRCNVFRSATVYVQTRSSTTDLAGSAPQGTRPIRGSHCLLSYWERPMSEKTRNTLLIAGSLVLAAIYIMFGAGKFTDPATWNAKFENWGVPLWFVPVSGALEIAGAIGLLIPVVRGVAGLALALFMVGAVGTHVLHAEFVMIFVAGAILIGSAVIGWVRLPETRAFLKRDAVHPQVNL